MPHLRKRHLTDLLEKSLRFSPITGLFGHRQAGKTTLAEILGKKYVTLDTQANRESAEDTPEAFIEHNQAKPFAIDECQMVPALFPALKEWVRTHKTPGQFLLTGSVRFSSRKAIRESLTGRIISWELLPMDLSEIHHHKLPNAIPQLLESTTLETELPPAKYFSEKIIDQYAKNGGLPGVFAIRDTAVQQQRFETQINTILERDLKLILQTTLDYRSLRNFAVHLALSEGEPLELASLARQTRISVPTIKKLLAAFEAMFFIRIIPTEGTERKPVLFFEDSGEANFLRKQTTSELPKLISFLYTNLRTQIIYRPQLGIEIFQYRRRGGATVPLCFRHKKNMLGVIPILTDTPDMGARRSANSFHSAYPNSKVIFVHDGKKDIMITSKSRVLGIRQLV